MSENIIIGRNPVLEAIKNGRPIDKLFVKSGPYDGSLKKVIGEAKKSKILIAEAAGQKLDQMADGGNHQGVVAVAAMYDYTTPERIMEIAREKGESPFVVICDRITDPHNLGSIIRTASGAGVHGIIISKHDSVGVNATVDKVSAGAAEFTPVARVTNLTTVIENLKKEGIWIYGADGEAESTIFETDFKGGVGIVIGNEGLGISRLIKEKCDFLVKIPMKGKTESLNASVAAALLMYEVTRKRINTIIPLKP